MQGFTKFFHHLFNPHCEECAREREQDREERMENAVCKSCDVLRMQLENATTEKRMLLDALTRRDVETVQAPPSEQPITLPGRHIPWRVKQQVLENESRQAAAILKKKMDELNPDAPPRNLHVTAPSSPSISTGDLEKELDLVEEERENNVRNPGQGN